MQLTYPGSGLYVNTDYLVTGEASAIRENGATSGVGVLATYAYDNLGNRTSVTYGNGAAQAFTYDAVSRLASLTNNRHRRGKILSYSPHNAITGSLPYPRRAVTVFVKSPMQMAREAEERRKPKRRLPKPGPVDPAKRPMLDGANFAAYLRTGQIEGRER